MTILLLSFHFREADAAKSTGKPNPLRNAKKVCGDTLCENPMSIREKIDYFLNKAEGENQDQSELIQQAIKKPSVKKKLVAKTLDSKPKLEAKSIPTIDRTDNTVSGSSDPGVFVSTSKLKKMLEPDTEEIRVFVANINTDSTRCKGLTPTIEGTNDSDFLIGTNGNDVIMGLDGSDWIYGLDSTDVICGNNGSDHIFAGDGEDYIITAEGGDNDHVFAGNGDDTIIVKSYSWIYGGTGEDTVYASDTIDMFGAFYGGEGTDSVYTEGISITTCSSIEERYGNTLCIYNK